MSIAEIDRRAGYLVYVTGRTARKEGQKDLLWFLKKDS